MPYFYLKRAWERLGAPGNARERQNPAQKASHLKPYQFSSVQLFDYKSPPWTPGSTRGRQGAPGSARERQGAPGSAWERQGAPGSAREAPDPYFAVPNAPRSRKCLIFI